jgi:uncharacterized protein YjbI with pentapeptide repeats
MTAEQDQPEQRKLWYARRQVHIAAAIVVGAVALLLGAVLGGGVVVVGALTAAVALGQLHVARLRHEAQTQADQQRRITESFAKAAEQLGSDKLVVRLGGIYTLERISRESPDDAWTIIETLTAFVREQARYEEFDHAVTAKNKQFSPKALRQKVERKMPTDIQAALTVIGRREEINRTREQQQGRRLDLQGTDLKGAYLNQAHFEEALLLRVHFDEASLPGVHFNGAYLIDAHFRGAYLTGARFEGAKLLNARFERAKLWQAHFEGAQLIYAHFEGAELINARGLTRNQLDAAYGDADTVVPEGTRPAHWPPARTKDSQA